MFCYLSHYSDQISDKGHPKGGGGDRGSKGTVGSKGTPSIPVGKTQWQEQGSSMTCTVRECRVPSSPSPAPPTFSVGLPAPVTLRWRLSQTRLEGYLFCDYGSCEAGSTSTPPPPEASGSSCCTFPAAFRVNICEFSQNVHFVNGSTVMTQS